MVRFGRIACGGDNSCNAAARHCCTCRTGRRSDQDRVLDAAYGRPCVDRQGYPDRLPDVGGGHQRQGRAAGPTDQAHILRRSKQSDAGSGNLRQAVRYRQNRPCALELRHQSLGALNAGRCSPQLCADGSFRPRGERELQLPLLFLHVPGGPGCHSRVLTRLFRDREGTGVEHAGDRRRRHRLRKEGRRRGARERPKNGAQDRLRPQLSAEHARLRSDRASLAGDQPGLCLRRVLPDGHRRDRASGQRDRAQDQAVRRWNGGPAICRAQDPARRAAQQDRGL
jgi:hypothetical protein